MATPGASRQNGLTSTAKAVSLREKRVAIKNDSAKKAEPFFRRKSAEGTLKNQSALCIQQHRAARSTPVPTHQSRVAKKGESEGGTSAFADSEIPSPSVSFADFEIVPLRVWPGIADTQKQASQF